MFEIIVEEMKKYYYVIESKKKLRNFPKTWARKVRVPNPECQLY